MKYRQWKKNYKKRHGVNPPASIDKRKRRKAAARATKALAKADFMESIGRAAETLTGAMANLMRALGNGMGRSRDSVPERSGLYAAVRD